MEWLNGPRESENLEVDIGYVQQMELQSTSASVSASEMRSSENFDSRFVPVGKNEVNLEEISWSSQISYDDALSILERKMYPFKQVMQLLLTGKYHKCINCM